MIGNASYRTQPLPNCKTDAEASSATLRRLGFTVTQLLNADLGQMRDGLDALRNQVTDQTLVLFYYSGHGVQVEGQNLLIPVDAKIATKGQARSRCLNLQEVVDDLQGAKTTVVILDCCRDDPLPAEAKSGSKGLIPLTAPADTLIAFAAGPGEVASANPTGKLSLYTEELLPRLEKPGLTLEDALKQTRAAVRKRSKNEQNPRYDTGLEENLVFRPADSPETNSQGTLHVTSVPSGALISVDGTSTGKRTPTDLVLTLGTLKEKPIELTLQLAGHYDERQPVTLIPGSTIPVEVRLRAKPETPTSPLPGGLKAGAIRVNAKDGAEMVWVPAGEFPMGSEFEDADEKPVCTVRISKGFWLYRHEVTVAQYEKFCTDTGRTMPKAPPWGWNDLDPMVKVSWHDAEAYSKWTFGRLPTEAEWEYAARGPQASIYPWGNTDPTPQLAIYNLGLLGRPLPANSFPEGKSWCGALHMAGNVWEWCSDWYAVDYYRYLRSPAVDPPGPITGTLRVKRGGSWFDRVDFLRASNRSSSAPEAGILFEGFRVVRTE